MEKTNHMPLLRQKNIKKMIVFSLVFFPVLCLLHKAAFGRVLASLIIQIVFWCTFIYQLEWNRVEKKFAHSIVDYHKLKDRYFAALVLTGIISFLPAFYKPLWVLPLFLVLLTTEDISYTMGIYLTVNLLLTEAGTPAEEYLVAVLLCISVWTLSKGLRSVNLLKYGLELLFFIQCILNMTGHFIALQRLPWYVLLGNFVSAGVAIAFFLFLTKNHMTRLQDKPDVTETDTMPIIEKETQPDFITYEEYLTLLRESFPLVKDIRNYSMSEYLHAKKVSKLAGLCTKEIGGNVGLAEAAGFYYRLGLLEGEPIIENAVKLAYDNCLPETIIRILEEYNGLQRLPQTKESAIIHMVELCVRKAELLNQNKLSSEWNDTMVIYQTLNETSATGIYDESGLSMNQFLRVREIMVQEGFGL